MTTPLTAAILDALAENNKPMSRIGIWGELPDEVAPPSIEAVSKALSRLKQRGEIESVNIAGRPAWDLAPGVRLELAGGSGQ